MALNKKLDVFIIGGAGHVGLPLALSFAKKGLRVGIYDLDQEKIKMIGRKKMPFLEYDAQPLLSETFGKTLFICPHLSDLQHAKSIVVTVGTPVDSHLNPSFLPIFDLAKQMLPFLKKDHHVILRSTVYPGTSRQLQTFFQENRKTVHVSFCPERIMQGYAIQELEKLPQIISAFSKKGMALSSDLFSKITNEIIKTGVDEAEFGKLFLNSWRYIKFAIANQFFMIANDHQLNYHEIHKAMTYMYPRAKDFVLPGFAAGPCLLKDTMQLAASTGNKFFLGHSAMLVNEGLPDYIVGRLKKKFDLKKKVVGILGMAFKAEIDDLRDSLSIKLKKLLQVQCKQLLLSDEYAQNSSYIPAEELVKKADLVIIGAPHKRYKGLNFKNKVVVDIWNHLGTGRIIV